MLREVLVAGIGLLCLAGCASVDQYGERIYDGNVNSQNALNNETLLNIVRASRYRSLNFIAISQITGGQSETLSTGLPTVSIGPDKTPAERVYQITNSLSSGVTGGYQSNPLVSTAFQNGILTPVTPREVALLAASRPRETVFYTLIDSIRFVDAMGNEALLVNDPLRNTPPINDGRSCDEIVSATQGRSKMFPSYVCSYSKFTYFLQSFVNNGLTVELASNDDKPGAATPTASGTNANLPTNGLPGRFCFEPSFASTDRQAHIAMDYKGKICGSIMGGKVPPSATVSLTSSTKTTFDHKEVIKSKTITETNPLGEQKNTFEFTLAGIGRVQASLILRSTASVYTYLGRWLRMTPKVPFGGYVTERAQELLGPNEPFLNVVQNRISSDCYTSIVYDGIPYCVPSTSDHTALLLDIAQVLRNFSIQPSDLNSAFTVRLTQ